jgi:DNA repair exonuclease SbcCD ATPase subunit
MPFKPAWYCLELTCCFPCPYPHKLSLADKERQVAVLTAEVERLQGRPVPPGGDGDGNTALLGSGALDAAGVINLRLVTFRSLAELVERNSQLLAVARSLAEDLDASRQGLEAKYAAARAAESADVEQRIAELTEMCNALATEAQACKRAADEALRDRQVRDQAGCGGGGGGRAEGTQAAAAAELEAACARVKELEAALSQLRTDAAESAAFMQQQLDAARSAEGASRSDAATARAQQQVLSNAAAALQQQVADANARVERLTGQLSSHRDLVERLEVQLEQVGG